jgi:hypothetical protein
LNDWFYPSLFEMPPSALGILPPPKPKARGHFDGDLQGYMLFFIKKQLSSALTVYAEDIRSETVLAILTQENLRRQLLKYLEPNEIPKGKDLSLLKAVLFRQRLKLIEKETRHHVERLKSEGRLYKAVKKTLLLEKEEIILYD